MTNGDYLEFINDSGYKEFAEFWLCQKDGKRQSLKSNFELTPLYWQKGDNGEWIKIDFRGGTNISEIKDEPVINISYFEADAYAKWAGKRLPRKQNGKRLLHLMRIGM